MIIVVDYGMGNLRSVHKALEKIGSAAKISNKKREISKATALVVPGVGAFGDCINNLTSLKLLEPITDHIRSGKPYLGICLGMQILFETSDEAPDSKGLGIFQGRVKKFPANVKIPHIGWNQIKIKNKKSNNNLLQTIPDNSYFYFVHSYYPDPEDKNIIVTTTDYGTTFASTLGSENIWATQYHPEKSQNLGLTILKNFNNYAYHTGS